MIDYNFYDLINKHPSLFTSYPYITITNEPFPSSESSCLIDEIWTRMIDHSIELFGFNAESILRVLKSDVVMSLYASLVFTNAEPIAKSKIVENLRKYDSALENEDSYASEEQNLAHHRRNLTDFYKPGGVTVPTSGQFFSAASLTYLKSFWESEQIKCFDITEFTKYIKNHSLWPYWKNNLYGMSFFDYFKGIREMSPDPDFYSPNASNSDPEFDNIFSTYIFEELFSPISFIQNIILHLKTFEDEFYKIQNPERERSMALMQPLFKLPNGLWELLSERYINSLATFIKAPNDLYNITELKANMGIVIFSSQHIFPLLKIIVGNIIYKENNGNLENMINSLKEYIVKNSTPTSFNHPTLLREQMRLLATKNYPVKTNKSIPLDAYGKYLLNPNSVKKPQGNGDKRNNNSILSYELNFTYNFFGCPDTYDFFTMAEHTPGLSPSYYTINVIYHYLNYSNTITNSLKTYNYVKFKATEIGYTGIII